MEHAFDRWSTPRVNKGLVIGGVPVLRLEKEDAMLEAVRTWHDESNQKMLPADFDGMDLAWLRRWLNDKYS